MPAPTGPDSPAHTWKRRLEDPDYLFGTEPNAWLRAYTSGWKPGQQVLFVADGEGRNSVWLARRGLAAKASDIAAAGLAKARSPCVAQRASATPAHAAHEPGPAEA